MSRQQRGHTALSSFYKIYIGYTCDLRLCGITKRFRNYAPCWAVTLPVLRRSIKLFHASSATRFGWGGVGHFAAYVNIGDFNLQEAPNNHEQLISKLCGLTDSGRCLTAPSETSGTLSSGSFDVIFICVIICKKNCWHEKIMHFFLGASQLFF